MSTPAEATRRRPVARRPDESPPDWVPFRSPSRPRRGSRSSRHRSRNRLPCRIACAALTTSFLGQARFSSASSGEVVLRRHALRIALVQPPEDIAQNTLVGSSRSCTLSPFFSTGNGSKPEVVDDRRPGDPQRRGQDHQADECEQHDAQVLQGRIAGGAPCRRRVGRLRRSSRPPCPTAKTAGRPAPRSRPTTSTLRMASM